MKVNRLVRNCVKKFKPYVPGKPVEELRRELKLKKIIKLASNENPLGPSPRVIKAIRRSAASVFRYPDGSALSLRKVIAKKKGVSSSNVICGSGTDEIIELIGMTFFKPGDNIVVSRHAFIRYKMAGDLMDITVREVPMKEYTHDIERMARAVDARTKAVFIANPNNPTGTYVPTRDLVAGLKRIRNNVLVILDEAYYEYASDFKDYPDGIKLLKKGYKNLIVLRTFSKVYGMAGLRIGYGVGDPAVIACLDRMRPPFNVTRISLDAAAAALSDNELIGRSVRMVGKGREYLYRELQKRGMPYVPSAGNFVLIKVPGRGMRIFRELLRCGIIVRAMDEYGLPGHIRVTVGKPDEMKAFMRSLSRII